jgi:sulfide:quinone oxidoreductase
MNKIINIIGGGFAGIEAAIYLRKENVENIEINLISNRDYFYIYPTSIWIPTHDIKQSDVRVPLKDIALKYDFNVIVDEITNFDFENKIVYSENKEYRSDIIILATGSAKLPVKGKEYFNSICGTPEEAFQIQGQLDEIIKNKSGTIAIGFGGNPKDSSSVRGGPAFEILFNIHNKLKKEGIRDNVDLIFFAPMKEPGAKMGKGSLKMMRTMFDKYNIKTIFGNKILEFKEKEIILEEYDSIKADMIMFIPAGSGQDIYKKGNIELSDNGYIKTNKYNEVEQFEYVYAIGDVAALEGKHEWKAKQGHVAEVMARNVAFNIKQKLNNKQEKKSYQEHLNILCVMDTGNGAAFVYRSEKNAFILPMPIIGHYMKKGWGWYCKNSKLGNIPRIPGM